MLYNPDVIVWTMRYNLDVGGRKVVFNLDVSETKILWIIWVILGGRCIINYILEEEDAL